MNQRTSALSDTERKQLVRKSLRLVKGGKTPMPDFNNRELNEDPFLREHFLGGRETKSYGSRPQLQEGLKAFLFGRFAESLPPDVG